MMRKIGIGCGGLLGLLLVVIVIAAVIGGTQEEQGGSPAPAPSPSPESAPSPSPPPAKKEAPEVVISVTGSPGIPFSGSYGTAQGGQRSVDGVVPTDYTVEVEGGAFSFDSVSAVMQKQGAEGELTVQILSDGEVLEEQSTTAQFGVASVSHAGSF
jgi:hypothetical protein